MPLIQVIYVSAAKKLDDFAELDAILASSAEHNRESQLTGMLLYANGCFIQVLEGDENAVDETFSRIRKDRRHDHIFLLERSEIGSRSFGNWHMGYKRLHDEELAENPAYAQFFSPNFHYANIGAKPGLAFDMLKNFAQTQRI